MRLVMPVALVWILLLAVVCPAFCVTPATHACCQHHDRKSEPCGSVMHGVVVSPAVVVPIHATAPVAVQTFSGPRSFSSVLPPAARPIPFSLPIVSTVLRI